MDNNFKEYILKLRIHLLSYTALMRKTAGNIMAAENDIERVCVILRHSPLNQASQVSVCDLPEDIAAALNTRKQKLVSKYEFEHEFLVCCSKIWTDLNLKPFPATLASAIEHCVVLSQAGIVKHSDYQLVEIKHYMQRLLAIVKNSPAAKKDAYEH